MVIENDEEYREVYRFLDWARQVFKTSWTSVGGGFLPKFEALADRYEEERFPKARPAGIETVCKGTQGCDHVHTGPMAPWPGDEDAPRVFGRSCMLCGCKRRL